MGIKKIKKEIKEIKEKLDIVVDELEKGELQDQLDDLEDKLDVKLGKTKKILGIAISGATLASIILGIILAVL